MLRMKKRKKITVTAKENSCHRCSNKTFLVIYNKLFSLNHCCVFQYGLDLTIENKHVKHVNCVYTLNKHTFKGITGN